MHPPVMVAGLALACLVGHSLAFDVPVVAPTNSTPWPSHCQPAMDAWCNSESLNSDCINAMRNKNATLPLYARFDTDEGHGTPERRCYSGTSLTPDHSHYEKGTSYCTRDAQLAQVQAECVSNITLVDVFTPGKTHVRTTPRHPAMSMRNASNSTGDSHFCNYSSPVGELGYPCIR
eukprot:m.78430 g.78430  ORF g.78430 m.78430 type:complete len:176 (-) comp14586_c0_seq1:1413-1940(-)